MVQRIGHVAVGDWVALAPSRRAQLYQVTSITGRHITLTPLDEDGHTKSVPVQSYRSIINVAWDDPRRPGHRVDPCGL